jgi:hypothetical protein
MFAENCKKHGNFYSGEVRIVSHALSFNAMEHFFEGDWCNKI